MPTEGKEHIGKVTLPVDSKKKAIVFGVGRPDEIVNNLEELQKGNDPKGEQTILDAIKENVHPKSVKTKSALDQLHIMAERTPVLPSK